MPQKKLQTKSANSYPYKKKQIRPIQAYIMTNMHPGEYNKALDEIMKIKFIEKISIVTGKYDIVVKVNVNNLEQLNKLTSELHKINGVERTNTQVIEKECQFLSSWKY